MGEPKPGWKRVRLGQLVELNKETSKDPGADGLDRYVGLDHIEPGDLRIRSWGDIAEGTTFTNRFRPGHVLFGKRRAYQRKVAVADFEGVCSGDIYVLEPKDLNTLLPDLLPFLCQTDAFFEHAVGTSAGSLSPRTNWKSLADYELELPPLPAQRVLARRLKVAQELLESTRQVAAASIVAFLSLRHSIFDTADRHVPWQAVRPLAELVAKQGIVDGPFGSNLKSEHWTDAGVPVISGRHITTGDYVVDEPYFVSTETFHRLHKSEVCARDIVMIKKGMSCGTAALMPDDHPMSLLSSNCMRIRADENIATAEWLYHFLSWFKHAGFFRGLIGSTQQRATTLRDVRKIEVPVPCMEAQYRLCDQLDEARGAIRAAELRARYALVLYQTLMTVWLGGGR